MNSASKGMTMENHVLLQGESDLSVRKYCQANGINEHTFRYWKTKLSKKTPESKFKLIESIDSSSSSTNPVMSLIYPNTTELHIYSVLDPGYIRQLI